MALVIVKPRKDSNDNRKVFYKFVRHVLIICRCIGVMPISGLWKEDSEVTSGNFKSWYTVIYVSFVIIKGMIISLITYHFFQVFEQHDYMIFSKFAAVIISTSNYMTILLLVRYGLKWDKLITQIEMIEIQLPSYNHKRTLRFVKILCPTILFLSIVERALYYLFTWQIIGNCVYQMKGEMNVKSYLVALFIWFFDYIAYNCIFGGILLVLNMLSDFFWSLADLFIMINCIYLSSKFKHYNELIKQKEINITHRIASWSSLQVHYTNISQLVFIIDDSISHMIVLSYIKNLLYIFKQIFFFTINLIRTRSDFYDGTTEYSKCLHKNRYNMSNTAYLASSCCFAILKLGLISHLAMKIHVLSRLPLNALHSFPSSAYNSDMRRLMTQIYYSKICLTGWKLFNITRQVILIMAVKLTTYELVMFQF